MAGPMIGGSAANDRVSTKITSPTFNISITCANPTPSVATVIPPSVPSDAKLVMANGAGAIVTGATFAVTVTGAYPVIGLEFKDTIVTASGSLLGAAGMVYSTSGSGNVAAGDSAWAGDVDLLLASAGVGVAMYFHIGNGNVATATNALPAKIDQATGTVKIFLTVYYLVG